MTIKRAIEIMKNERQCVEMAESDICGMNCFGCDLELSTDEISEARDSAIGALEYYLEKHQLIIGGNCND